jgi:sugar/nucleoside kinase (ribokinase family)
VPQNVDAVVAGHLCLDVFPDLSAIGDEQFRRALVPGRLTQVGAASFCTGGPVSNVGLALHKLGISTQLMGKVGDDVFGQVIRQIVASHDPVLADGMVIDPSVGSSYTIVLNPAGSDRFFLHFPGANDTFGLADVRFELLERARLFHFGYPPIMRLMFENEGAQLVEVFRRAKATGVTTSLDMAVPDPASAAGKADWVAILEATLPFVDIFLPSIEEILFMVRRSTFEQLERQAGGSDILPLITPVLLSDISRQLLQMGTSIVGLKLGYRGFYLHAGEGQAILALGRARPSEPHRWAGRELWTPCFVANEVGTAGSGDATIAGFLAALLRDLSPEDAVTAAVAVGACNVEAADTLSGIRSWEETMARVTRGWPHHSLSLDAAGWHFDQGHGLWVGPAD